MKKVLFVLAAFLVTRVSKSQNVGVGNTTPSSRLHVSSGELGGAQYIGSAVSIFESSNIFGAAQLQLMNPSGQVFRITSGTELLNNRASISFRPDSSITLETVLATERMRVKKNGDITMQQRLGVGQNDPLARLHLSNGTLADALYLTTSLAILETNSTLTAGQIQLVNPSNQMFRLISGTELINNRSSISFRADSSLTFETVFGTERMKVKKNGDITMQHRLGIGQNDPLTRLHLSNGTLADALYLTTSLAILETNSTLTAGQIQLVNPSNQMFRLISGTELINNRSSISFRADSSLTFETVFGTERMKVKKNGDITMQQRLGIGQNDPLTRLHLSNGTVADANYLVTSLAILESNNTIAPSIVQLMNPANQMFRIISGTDQIDNRASISFRQDSSMTLETVFGAERMRIKKNGDITMQQRLGIGQNDPVTRFHVSSGSVPGALYLVTSLSIFETNNTVSPSQIQLMNPSNQMFRIISGTELTSNRGSVSFRPDSSVTIETGAGSEKFRVTKNGLVGINETDPVAFLDVAGTFKLGSAGTVNSGLIKTSVLVDVPSISANGETDVTVTLAGTLTGGAVSLSPSNDLPNGILISWARVFPAGSIRIHFRNLTGSAVDPPAINYHISVVQ